MSQKRNTIGKTNLGPGLGDGTKSECSNANLFHHSLYSLSPSLSLTCSVANSHIQRTFDHYGQFCKHFTSLRSACKFAHCYCSVAYPCFGVMGVGPSWMNFCLNLERFGLSSVAQTYGCGFFCSRASAGCYNNHLVRIIFFGLGGYQLKHYLA